MHDRKRRIDCGVTFLVPNSLGGKEGTGGAGMGYTVGVGLECEDRAGGLDRDGERR